MNPKYVSETDWAQAFIASESDVWRLVVNPLEDRLVTHYEFEAYREERRRERTEDKEEMNGKLADISKKIRANFEELIGLGGTVREHLAVVDEGRRQEKHRMKSMRWLVGAVISSMALAIGSASVVLTYLI